MRKQAAALVTPACSRKLLPPCQQLLPRTVHFGAAAAHRSSSLGFPASRGCSPADTDFSAAVLLLARAAASSGSPQTVCRVPDAAHLALALVVSKPRREPPGTSVVRLSSSLVSRYHIYRNISSLLCFIADLLRSLSLLLEEALEEDIHEIQHMTHAA
ncbi:hypothetical protein NDU88_009738 [Pleurodeles waltl]|uniref:Uncharacterized protein n=1 Tax=Pleurodeles waltl TaxID=8319 RepID=A0AAV7RZ66_PLEWA|nr:hypothetical protein NDU88_009738 [Pleurodeles waltl]